MDPPAANESAAPIQFGGWKPAAAVGLCAAFFHAALFLAVPFERQDFPLSDDWAYALGAFSFLRGDGPRYCDWSATPLLGQWIWSAPFVALLGENHQSLRISTAVLHVVFAVGCTALLSGLRVRRGPLIAAVVVFHPVLCLAAVTFLTDVPTLAFSIVALSCWTAGRGGGFLGVVFGMLAVLNRQSALAAPGAFLGSLILRSPDVPRRRWIGPIIVFAAGLAVATWFSKRTDIVNYPLKAPSLGGLIDALLAALFFCGLGLSPVIAFVVPWKRFLIGSAAAGALWCIWASACHWSTGDRTRAAFPFAHNLGNLLTFHGPFGDAFTIGSRPPLIEPLTRDALTGIAVMGAGGLLAAISLAPWKRWTSPFVLFGIAHLVLPVVSSLQFDRYYLPVLVGTAFLLPREPGPSSTRTWAAWLPVLGWALLSFALCRDWLTVNAAKWELGRRALASGIAVEEIEGGLEWDFHHAWANGRPPKVAAAPRQGFAVPFSLERLPHLTGRYALSLGDDPRFQAVDRAAYQHWLPWRQEEVVLLKAW